MNKEKFIKIMKNIVAVIVVAAMFIIIFYQNRDRDVFKFGKEESSKHIEASETANGNFTGGDIGKVGDKVALLTTMSYTLLDENAQSESTKIVLSDPLLHADENYAVCYNTDSFEITVFKQASKAYSVTVENKIISAKVNKNGYLLAVTEKEGYNCECRVYNRTGEAVFKWDISKSEFLDGDINCKNNAIALSLTSSTGNKLVGEVVIVSTANAEVIEKQSYDSEIFYSVNFNSNDTFTALGNKRLVYFNSDGTEKWSYNYGDKELLKADVSNHNNMILAFTDSKKIVNTHSTDVKIINRLGEVSAEKNYDQTVSDISVNEDSVAIALGKEIHITNEKLKDKRVLKTYYIADKIVLYDDSRHLFVLGDSGGEILE